MWERFCKRQAGLSVTMTYRWRDDDVNKKRLGKEVELSDQILFSSQYDVMMSFLDLSYV
jgi:hypothetical protein